MSKFLLTNLSHVRKKTYSIYLFFQSQPFSSSAKSIQNSSIFSTFTVDYLMNSCGLTAKRAVSASKSLNFNIADKPNSVLTLFKDQGFTQTQISKIVNYWPRVLLSDPEKTLLPKLEFFKSKGYSDADIVVIISRWPEILMRSLENQLVPTFNFFSDLLLSDGKKSTIASKYCVGVLMFDLQKHGQTNVNMLKQTGVPIRNIRYLLANYPRIFTTNCDKFRLIVDEVKRMGFDPLRLKFGIAVKVLISMTNSTKDGKLDLYKKWGWSDKEVAAAFCYHPTCMALSENNINSVMEFWVVEMGWESSFLATLPTILSMSLEKRIIPRCKVYQALLLKGFEKPCGFSLSTWFTIPEKKFLQKITKCHEEEALELLKLYNEKRRGKI